MLRTLMLAALLLLAGCVGRPPLPDTSPHLQLPLQLHIQRTQEGQREDWLLVVQQEGDSLRWSLLDFLGIPQARQKLIGHRWEADGLLPPNPAARELFAAMLFALTPDDQLLASYPKAQRAGTVRSLGTRWSVNYGQPLYFSLNLKQGLHYMVSPLPAEITE